MKNTNDMVIYKITNLINNKIYIGRDTRNRLNYYGSGRAIKEALREFGRKNFKKEIIEHCNNMKELKQRENYWILYYNSNNEIVGYNLHKGGEGYDCSGKKNPMYNLSLYDYWRKLYDENEVERRIQQHKTNMSKAMMGENNGMYGKSAIKGLKWINNGKENKYIAPNEVQTYLNEGWVLGRSKERIWINNRKEEKWINKELSQEYLDSGWKKGRKLRGSKHPRSKVYVLISPEGKEYIIKGDIDQKLKEINLSRGSLHNLQSGKKDEIKGWKFKE